MTPLIRFLVPFTVCALSLHQVSAQRELKNIPAPDPELEKATFRVPEGFEVNLFASDPVIAKPIQMNFDEDGRLWIASSEVYPQIVPGAPATDRAGGGRAAAPRQRPGSRLSIRRVSLTDV